MLWKWQVINDLQWNKWKMRNGKWKIGKVDSENVVPIFLSRSFSAARKGHVFGAQSPTTPSPLYAVKREFCSRFVWVATVSACWPWTFRHELRPTTTANHAVIVATNTGISRASALAKLGHGLVGRLYSGCVLHPQLSTPCLRALSNGLLFLRVKTQPSPTGKLPVLPSQCRAHDPLGRVT